MRVALPRRTTVAGDVLEVLVLSVSGGELIGVDLASGAFLRATDPGGERALQPFEVVRAELVDGEPLWSPHAPESVELAENPEVIGRLCGRRAERFLRPLLDPPGDQLLGFAGPSVPFWTLTGDRPSLALLAPSIGPLLVGGHEGYRCRFVWRGREHVLPLFDTNLVGLLERRGRWRATGASLDRLLGYHPSRVLVALSPPWRGHCYKVAAAVLPRA